MSLFTTLSFSVVSVLCIFSIVKLFARGHKEYAKSALSSYVIYLLLFLAIRIFSLPIPDYSLLLTMATVLLACFFGHYLQLYTKSHTFDRYLHAFGSFSFALFSYYILDFFINTGHQKLFQAIFIFLAGNTLGVFFEFLEAKHDMNAYTKSQKGLQDTNMDMLFNMIGALAAAIYAYFGILQ